MAEFKAKTQSLGHVRPLPDGRIGISIAIDPKHRELFEILQSLILFTEDSDENFWLPIAEAYIESQAYRLRGKHFVTGQRLHEILNDEMDMQMANSHVQYYRRKQWTEGKEYIVRMSQGNTQYLYDMKHLRPFFERIRDVKLGLIPQEKRRSASKPAKKAKKPKSRKKVKRGPYKAKLTGRQALVAVPKTVEDSRTGE